MDDDDVVFAIKIGETKTFVQDVEFDKNTFSMIADVELFDNLPETFEFAGATLSKEEYLDLLTGNDLEGLGLNDAAAKATLFSFGLDVLMDDHKIKFMVDSYRAGTLKFQPRLWTLSVLKYMPKKLYNKLISKIPV